MDEISGVGLRLGINVKCICRNIGWNSYVFNKGTFGVSSWISERDTGELVATNAISPPSIVFFWISRWNIVDCTKTFSIQNDVNARKKTFLSVLKFKNMSNL